MRMVRILNCKIKYSGKKGESEHIDSTFRDRLTLKKSPTLLNNRRDTYPKSHNGREKMNCL